MTLQDHLVLWNKIQLFPLDDEKATLTFSGKLQAEQRWTPPFTKAAIEEYRKFMLLCCISERGAAPSQTVDEVWHLHLTYTKSYWTDFCRDTLGKEVHHYPSAGGELEDRRHQEWYKATLQLYRSVFGVDAPAAIWRPPVQTAGVLEEPRLYWTGKKAVTIGVLLALPFLISVIIWHTASPFRLNGPEFLVFFPIYGAAIIGSYALYRQWVIGQIGEITTAHFPHDASAFRSSRYTSAAEDTNPLLPFLAQTPDGSMESYESLLVNWYEPSGFTHPALDSLTRFARRKEPFLQRRIFHIAFYTLFALRMIQGFFNERPLAFLVAEAMLLWFIFSVVRMGLSRKDQVYRNARRLYREQLQDGAGASGSGKDSLIPQFVLAGLPAISGYAEGVLLAGVFGAYASNNYLENMHAGNKGSGCSGGSSCGGGSSCSGGSGCGGCGGGH